MEPVSLGIAATIATQILIKIAGVGGELAIEESIRHSAAKLMELLKKRFKPTAVAIEQAKLIPQAAQENYTQLLVQQVQAAAAADTDIANLIQSLAQEEVVQEIASYNDVQGSVRVEDIVQEPGLRNVSTRMRQSRARN